MFFGRNQELDKLNQMYESDNFEFAIIYGRRRVGKTALIKEFCKNKKSIYSNTEEAVDNLVKNENVANYANQIIQIKINPNQN